MPGPNSRKNYYAVREGYNPGVYTSWPAAQQQVNGYSRNVFKGFDTYEEARNFAQGQPSGGCGSSYDYYGFRGGNVSGVTHDYEEAARQTYGVPGASMKNFPNNPEAAWQYAQGGNQIGYHYGSSQNGSCGHSRYC